MPIDYKKYADNFLTELRPAVLKRAKNKCEHCGVDNYAIVQKGGFKHATQKHVKVFLKLQEELGKRKALKTLNLAMVVLTTAHLDQNLKNNDLKNLAALCQRCHLIHDKVDNLNKRKYGKEYNTKQKQLQFK